MFAIIRTKAEWDSYHIRLVKPSVYASYDYVKAAEILEQGGLAELAVFENNGNFVLHPYVKRTTCLKDGVYDLTCAHDFGGFWFSTRDSHVKLALLNDFSQRFTRYCRENNICSEFIRYHPFNDFLLNKNYEKVLIENNVAVNLKRDYREIYSGFNSSLKRAIRKAESYTLTLRHATVEQFLKLYYDNLRYLKSKRYYYFPLSFLEKLEQITSIFCLGTYDLEGKLCTSQIYLKDGKFIFYYLGGSKRETLPKRPNDFLFWNAIKLFKDKGFDWMYLGGGSDSLLKYKQKFSKETVPYYIGKRIFNTALYKELVRLKEEAMGRRIYNSVFFPAYRFSNE